MAAKLLPEQRTKIRKLLLRSTNWIGDAVMTTPAVRSIRQALPQAEITLLAQPWVADVFRHSPQVDRILNYEKKGRHRGLAGMFRLAGELRREHFDAAVLLQNAFEAAFITCLAGIPIRAGYTTDGRGLLLTHGVKKKPDIHTRHQVYYYQEMVQGLGLETGLDSLELFVGPAEKEAVGNILRRAGVKESMQRIGLNPGAAYGPAKRWPAEKYADLAARLCQDANTCVLIFGAEADHEAAATIRARVRDNPRVLDLTGKTTLSQAMALIGACDCFVTNDSGLMHVAAALRIPLVAIFGSTNHITTPPFSPEARIIRQELDCSPCMRTHCPQGHFRCMEDIGVESVLSVVRQQLAGEETEQ